MIFRRLGSNPTETGRKLSPSFFVSLGVHLVVAVALMRMLILNADFAPGKKRVAVPAERIGFVRLPSAGDKPPVAGRSGGDGRPEKSREIHIVAPTTIPTTLPALAPVTARPEPEAGSGPLVGTGGPARGIRPSYSDPRVWEAPGKIVTAPKTVAQTIDSLIADAIAPYNDSIAAVAQQRDPTDWTIKKGGQTWGIDRKAIRLGPVSIPTALLAMLPLNITGNPTTMTREAQYAAMHRDINIHAQQAINEADFMKAVRSIRERKERERAAALSPSSGSSGSKEPSGDRTPRD
jgi:hypothetical protein